MYRFDVVPITEGSHWAVLFIIHLSINFNIVLISTGLNQGVSGLPLKGWPLTVSAVLYSLNKWKGWLNNIPVYFLLSNLYKITTGMNHSVLEYPGVSSYTPIQFILIDSIFSPFNVIHLLTGLYIPIETQPLHNTKIAAKFYLNCYPSSTLINIFVFKA